MHQVVHMKETKVLSLYWSGIFCWSQRFLWNFWTTSFGQIMLFRFKLVHPSIHKCTSAYDFWITLYSEAMKCIDQLEKLTKWVNDNVSSIFVMYVVVRSRKYCCIYQRWWCCWWWYSSNQSENDMHLLQPVTRTGGWADDINRHNTFQRLKSNRWLSNWLKADV